MTIGSTDSPTPVEGSRRRQRLRRWRDPLLAPLTKLLELSLGAMSWRAAQTAGRWLGGLAWKVSRRDRERALAHLAIAFPDMSPAERARIARNSSRQQGMNFAECMHLLRQDLDTTMTHIKIVGQEHLEAVAERSALVITGHCGNWELLSPAFSSLGLPLAAVVRALDEAWAEETTSRLRQRFGTRVVRRGRSETIRGLLAVLRRPTFLAMLIDQDIRAESVWVPFFGKLAHTAVGPADFAMRRSLPVVPAFCERLADGSHIVRFQKPFELPPDRTEATAIMTQKVEEQIRRCPDQWVWPHRRWRRRPRGEE